MFVDLTKKIIEVKEKGYINSRLEIIVDTPPQWVLDELDKFFKDFKDFVMEINGKELIKSKNRGNIYQINNERVYFI